MIGTVAQWFTNPANWQGTDGVPSRVWEHLQYAGIAIAIAIAIAMPLGLLIGHTGRGTFLVAGTANSLRALPTLGLLILVVLLLAPRISNDLAFTIPALAVLVLLGVPPILTNTYAGVQNVDPQARDAASGMGMTGSQVLFRVELPCSMPLVMSGIRSATLQIIATATVAAYVSLGGLGRYVVDGLARHDYAQMAAGAVLVAALAVIVDVVLAGVQRLVVPRGLAAARSPSRARVRGRVRFNTRMDRRPA